MSLAYAQIHATTRALYSHILSSQVWSTLIYGTQDLDTLLDELADTIYGSYLELDRDLLTPRRIVYQIKLHLASVYRKLIRIAPKPAAHLLRQLWRFYEVDNLKAALRGLETGATWEQILFLLSPIPKHAELSTSDMQRIVETGNVIRAVERLQHTPYYDTLAHALDRYQVEHSLFPLEVALDLDYHRDLWQSIQHLTGKDHKYALRIVGTALNADSMLWALRYRRYHHLSAEEIINYTFPGPSITVADIRTIATGERPCKVFARIFPDIGGKIPRLQDTRNLRILELMLQRYIVNLCRKVFIGDPFHIGIPLAFLRLSEHEIRDLTTVIEAKASRMPPATFIPYLETYRSTQEPVPPHTPTRHPSDSR